MGMIRCFDPKGKRPMRMADVPGSSWMPAVAGRCAESLEDPLHWKRPSLRYLHDPSHCYRLERQLPGGSLTRGENTPFTAH